MKYKDERIRLMNEILGGIKVSLATFHLTLFFLLNLFIFAIFTTTTTTTTTTMMEILFI